MKKIVKITTIALVLFLVCSMAAFAGGRKDKKSPFEGTWTGTIIQDTHHGAMEHSKMYIFSGDTYIVVIPYWHSWYGFTRSAERGTFTYTAREITFRRTHSGALHVICEYGAPGEPIELADVKWTEFEENFINTQAYSISGNTLTITFPVLTDVVETPDGWVEKWGTEDIKFAKE